MGVVIVNLCSNETAESIRHFESGRNNRNEYDTKRPLQCE